MIDITKITDELTTKKQADELIWILKSFQQSLYKTPFSDSLIKKALSFELAQALSDLIDSKKTTNKQVVAKIITDVISEVEKIPTVKLTLATAPSALFLEKCLMQIESMTKTEKLLEINIDPKIIGGATIEYQGKYKDYSLRSKLNVSS